VVGRERRGSSGWGGQRLKMPADMRCLPVITDNTGDVYSGAQHSALTCVSRLQQPLTSLHTCRHLPLLPPLHTPRAAPTLPAIHPPHRAPDEKPASMRAASSGLSPQCCVDSTRAV
jgi:hypothetical protein